VHTLTSGYFVWERRNGWEHSSRTQFPYISNFQTFPYISKWKRRSHTSLYIPVETQLICFNLTIYNAQQRTKNVVSRCIFWAANAKNAYSIGALPGPPYTSIYLRER